MNLNALGGSNTVYMVSLAVDSGLMFVNLRSAGGINGDNNVFAQAVTTLFGQIDGGGSPTWGPDRKSVV